MFARHVTPLDDTETDFVAVAQKFVCAPYLWGGRESAGIDCSGLVQVSLQATGIFPLRDSDMHEQTLGLPLEPGSEFSNMERGDLVFWKNHVGIMQDHEILLHANAYSMAVTSEDLKQAAARIAASDGPIRAVKRLS